MSSDIVPFLKWWFFTLMIGWITFPITFRLFKNQFERGFTVTKILGILLVSFFHWILNILGLSQNSQAGILMAIILVLGGSFWVLNRAEWSEFKNWCEKHLSFVLLVELVFLLAFIGMAWVRAYNPDINGTEKPMELMFINSILRSPTFPPQDAWLSAYSISYYYFGYVMVALIAKLTATAAGVAFNLAIALIFALAFIGSFGIILNLISRYAQKTSPDNFQLMKVVPFAFLGPTVLLLVGNFYGILNVLHTHHIFADLEVPAVWFETGRIDQESQAVIEPQVVVGRINFWEWMDLKLLNPIPAREVPFQGIQQGNWFFASRVVHDRNLTGYDPEAIDEFPAFSFLLADLHPHVLGLPFVLLVILLCFEWMLNFRHPKEDLTHQPVKLDRIALSAIILGSLIFLNTWDFPIYVFLFGLSGSLAHFHQNEENFVWKNFLQYLYPVISVMVLSVILYIPFLVGLQSQAGGIIPNAIYPTKLRQSFVMFGPLLVAIVSFVILVLRKNKQAVDYKFGLKTSLAFLILMALITVLLVVVVINSPTMAPLVNGAISPFTLNQAIGWLLMRRVVEGGTLLVGLLLMVAVLAVLWGLRKKGSASLMFIFSMLITGTLLLLGPEFVYLRDNFGWRMNTLFKFYFQIWIMWSLAAGFGFWYLLKQAKGWGRIVVSTVVGVGFLLGSVYTVGTIQTTTAGIRGSVSSNGLRTPTLDGLEYYRLYYPDDWALIDWMNNNLPHDAIILEGTKGAYWVEGRSSRVSMITGFPTVMGWVNHEAQWRGDYFSNLANRESDIQTIYTTRDWIVVEDLLDRYGVTHVIVSPLEYEWYRGIQQNKFDQNMQRVFEYNGAVIYQR